MGAVAIVESADAQSAGAHGEERAGIEHVIKAACRHMSAMGSGRQYVSQVADKGKSGGGAGP